MVVQSPRSLPGIRFEREAPPPTAVLPRMDVAGFVGFAAAGPIDTPVPVEDIARFREIFGPDPELAWDPARGTTTRGHLGGAVEAFFGNGGRRCWVVRVAGRGDADRSSAPIRNRFRVPGVVAASTGEPATARARSPGTWSDDLAVGTVLTREVLGKGRLSSGDEKVRSVEIGRGGDRLQSGDLLEAQIENGDDGPSSLRVALTVTDVARGTDEAPASDRRGVQVRAVEGRWYRRWPAWPVGDDDEQPAKAHVTSPDADAWSGLEAEVRLEKGRETDFRGYKVAFDERPPTPEPGQVIHLKFDEGEMLWLAVGESRMRAGLGLEVVADDGIWPVDRDDREVRNASSDGNLRSVERLTFDLLAWRRGEIVSRLGELGFSAQTEPQGKGGGATARSGEAADRFWGRLPTDEDVFRLRDGTPDPPEAGTVEADAYDPRFPLAGPERGPSETPSSLFLPLGMRDRPDPASSLRALPSSAERQRPHLSRNGLDPFGADLFVDCGLADRFVSQIDAAVKRRWYFTDPPEPLRGLHSLFPVSEVTLLAVPDAVQPGWKEQQAASREILHPPPDFDVDEAQEPGVVECIWEAVSTGRARQLQYELQEADNPDFREARSRYQGSDTAVALGFRGERPQVRFFRVRAVAGDRVGPWSVTRAALSPRPDFAACERDPIGAPESFSITDASGSSGPSLEWTPVSGATAYTLEEAVDPAFNTARPVLETVAAEKLDPKETGTIRYPTPEGSHAGHLERTDWVPLAARLPVLPVRGEITYYRVRAHRGGEAGPWSTTVVRRVDPPERRLVKDAEDFGADGWQALLDIHRTVLRFCAARADVLSVLSVPGHARVHDALKHVDALTAVGPAEPDVRRDDGERDRDACKVRALRPDELRALSYGALYHPWAGHRGSDSAGDRVRHRPPDGVLCGQIASRALRDGAWAAPANEPFTGVLSLDPSVGPDGWRRLDEGQINAIRREPGGFTTLNAQTLAAHEELRPIGVRRLLILLRRLVLREAPRFVFAANETALRERVVFQLEGLLERLYRRGAFAGGSPPAAYRVRADASVNPPERVEHGELVVELDVAPSRPLAFLTVRLTRQGGTELRTEET